MGVEVTLALALALEVLAGARWAAQANNPPRRGVVDPPMPQKKRHKNRKEGFVSTEPWKIPYNQSELYSENQKEKKKRGI